MNKSQTGQTGQTTIQITAENAKFSGIQIRNIETKSGAKVRLMSHKKQVIIYGDEKQRARAATLIRESLNKAFFIPTIGYTCLELDNLTDVNKAKFKFVEYEGDDTKVTSKNKDVYFVQLMEETKDNSESPEIDDLVNSFSQKLEISSSSLTNGFTVSEKLDYCLSKIYSQLPNADPTDLERKEIRLNLFFGREMFFNVDKRIFSVNEWVNFTRKNKRNGSLFQHNAPQILEKMSILEKKFGFKEDKRKETKGKGSITIHFEQDSKRRKLKLHWNAEENLWKITKHVGDINRLAILDIISGSEAPDCRFLLKTCYNYTFSRNIMDIIKEIQSEDSFKSRDKIWFQVKDFDGKLENVEIRQTMSKRRFFNERFQISVVSIKELNSKDESIQVSTSLKNRSWRSVENIDQNLSLHYDEQEISNTICETVQFAREIAKALS